MSSATIAGIYRAAVDAVLPDTVLPAAIRCNGPTLTIGGVQVNLDRTPVHVIAFGKAAGEMTASVASILRDRLAGAIAVVKTDPGLDIPRTQIVVGSHPVPDQRSLDAGEAVLRFSAGMPDGALVLCLISGGGSALMESLRDGVDLDQLRQVTRELLRAGASIHELNAVRARLSAIKAGGLLHALAGKTLINLIISDVLGDDLSTIASGPTVPRQRGEPAQTVLERYGVKANLPAEEVVVAAELPQTLVLGSISVAIDAAVEHARRAGLTPVVISRSIAGEARVVGDVFASMLADSAKGLTAFGPGTCLIAGGETTVTVRGSGRGGRNTEAALAAAIRLAGVSGVTAGFLATDGDDAESGVAGGIVTGETVNDIVSAQAALVDNDSWTWLDQRNSTWGTGPTGTNVNDLLIGIISLPLSRSTGCGYSLLRTNQLN